MDYEDTNVRCLVLKQINPGVLQRRRLVQSLSLKYSEEPDYIEKLITFFSGDPFGLPNDEQKERVEKHLQKRSDESYHQRVNRRWNGKLTLFVGKE